jgi:hypothetical protein
MQRMDIEFWLVSFPKSVPPLLLRSHQCVIRCADRSDHHYGCPFDCFQILCNISWHAEILLRHHHTSLIIGDKFQWVENISPIKPNHNANFFAGPSSEWLYHCTSDYPLNSIWLLCHLLHVTPITSDTSHQKLKRLTRKLQAKELHSLKSHLRKHTTHIAQF